MLPEVIDTATAYQGWTRLLRVRVRLEDETTIEREVEDHGGAVAVLPYDPVRRTALVIRLLRVPVLMAAGMPALVEAPAGMTDGEDPAGAARRELYEETGLRVDALEHVGRAWTMPGISTEQMDLYLAPYSARDRVGSGGGLADENENITVCEMPLEALWTRVLRNEISDMKTLTLLLMLHVRKPHLFATAE